VSAGKKRGWLVFGILALVTGSGEAAVEAIAPDRAIARAVQWPIAIVVCLALACALGSRAAG